MKNHTTFYTDCTSLGVFTSYTEQGGQTLRVSSEDGVSYFEGQVLAVNAQLHGRFQLHKNAYKSGDSKSLACHYTWESVTYSDGDQHLLMQLYDDTFTIYAEAREIYTAAGKRYALVDLQDNFFTTTGTEEYETDQETWAVISVSDEVYKLYILDSERNLLETIEMAGRTYGTDLTIHDFQIGKSAGLPGRDDQIVGEIRIYDIVAGNDDIYRFSIASDHKNSVVKIYPSVEIDISSRPAINYAKRNGFAYTRSVDITYTGGVINSAIPIKIDTAALIAEGKMTENCSDIEVLSSTFEKLDHYVESPNQTYTLIWVSVVVPNNGVSIILNYGNPGAVNTSDLGKMPFKDLYQKECRLWLRANEGISTLNNSSLFNVGPTDTVTRWRNSAPLIDYTDAEQEETADAWYNVQSFRTTVSSGLPAFNGMPHLNFTSGDFLKIIGNKNLQVNYPAIFVVYEDQGQDTGVLISKSASNQATTSDAYNKLYLTATQFASGSVGDTFNYAASNATYRQLEIWARSADARTYTRTNGGGYFTTTKDLDYTTYNDQSLLIGKSDTPNTTPFVGRIAEIIILSEYNNTEVPFAKTLDISNYLRLKYRMSGTLPTTIIGEEFTVENNFQYEPFNTQVQSVNIHQRLEDGWHGLAVTEAEVELSATHRKNIATFRKYEGWSNTGVNEDSHRYIDVTDTLSIHELEIYEDLDLDSYDIDNSLYPAHTVLSTTDDYIQFGLFIDDIDKLDLSASSIGFKRYRNSFFSHTVSTLTNNVGQFVSGYNTVTIRKNSFNINAWINIHSIDLRFKAKTGETVRVKPENLRMISDISAASANYAKSNPVRISMHISSDGGKTYAQSTQFVGRIDKNSTQGDNVSFVANDIIPQIYQKTLNQIQAFKRTFDTNLPDNVEVFNNEPLLLTYLDSSDGFNGVPTTYRRLCERILGWIASKKDYEVDLGSVNMDLVFLDLIAELRKDVYISTLLRELVKKNFGILATRYNGELRLRGAGRWLLEDKVDHIIPLNRIIKAKQLYNREPVIVNKLSVPYQHPGNLSVFGFGSTITNVKQFNLRGLEGEDLSKDTEKTFEFDADTLRIPNTLLLNPLYVDTWKFGEDSNSPAISSTYKSDIEIVGYRIEKNVVYITFVNNSTVKDYYLKNLDLFCQSVLLRPAEQTVYRDSESINRLGNYSEVIDAELIPNTDGGRFGTGGDSTFGNDLVQRLKVEKKSHELDIIWKPNMSLGDQVKFVDTLGINRVGCIHSIDTRLDRYEQTLRILEA